MGSGYKTFTAGEVLTASSVQNFLQNQTVMSFADSAARSSAIGTANFEEGMTSYLQDTNLVEVYDGTNWASIAPSGPTPGLVQIGTAISFSAVSSFSFPADTFTSTYDNYKIILSNVSGSTGIEVRMRLRASGTDNTSNIYYQQQQYNSSTTISGVRQTSTVWTVANANTGTSNFATLELFNPKITQITRGLVIWQQSGNTTPETLFQTMTHDSATAFDSATILASTGNITGVASVYGFSK